jgi:nitrogen-specific signal transduction histidine kinase
MFEGASQASHDLRSRRDLHRILDGFPDDSTTMHCRYVLDTIDDGRVWVDQYETPIEDDNGQLLGFYSTITDVTAEVAADRRHSVTDDRHRMVLRLVEEAVLELDHRLRIRDCNDAAVRLLECDRDELCTLTLAHLLPLRSLEQNGVDFTKPDAAQRVQTVTATGSGARVPVEVSMARSNATLGQCIVVIRPSVAAMRTGQDIVKDMKMDSIMAVAAGLGHDLRNLMDVLERQLRRIRAKVQKEDPESWMGVEATEQRAHELAARLSAVGGREPTNLAIFDVAALRKDLEPVLDEIVGPEVDIRFWAEPDAFSILGDRSQVDRVVMNLVHNAADAMDGTGTVDISVEGVFIPKSYGHVLRGPAVVVRVSDTGCGMAPEMLTNIFDPGYSSKGGSGHGVGLAHARATIRDLGGEILVRSELGVGTQFALVIPRLTDRQADANDWPVGRGFDAFSDDSDDHGARNGEADETAGDAADDPIVANAIDLRDCREDQVGGLVEQPSEIAFDGGIDLPAAATAIGLEESSLVDDDEFLPNALGSPIA